MPKNYIYIGGYGRSGSTLLDSYLSSSDSAIGVGEVVNIFDDILIGAPCSCGKLLGDCVFWADFVNGYSGERIRNINKSAREAESSLWPRVTNKNLYEKYVGEYLSYVFKNKDVVVDSSKSTRRSFYRAVNISRHADVFFIYLCRDPRGLVSSLLKGSNKSLDGKHRIDSLRFFIWRSFFGWLIANCSAVYSARKLAGNGVLLKYEDFCKNPEAIVFYLQDVGVKIQPPVSIRPGHGVSGNRMRASVKEIEAKPLPDLKEFSLGERALIILMSKLNTVFVSLSRLPFLKVD